MLLRTQTEQNGFLIVDRTTERSADGQRIVVANGHLQAAVALRRWRSAAHVNETAKRFGPVPAALRTSQYFYRFDVEQRRDGPDATKIDVVDQETDGWIRRALVLLQLTDAANLEVPGTVAVARPAEIGHDVDEFFEVLHSRFFDNGRVDDADTRRQFTDRAAAKVRLDNNLVNRLLGENRR